MVSNNSVATARTFTAASACRTNPLTVVLPSNIKGVPEVRALREGWVKAPGPAGRVYQQRHVVIPGPPAVCGRNPESVLIFNEQQKWIPDRRCAASGMTTVLLMCVVSPLGFRR
jgi:hypothetical protein